jgi:uncharacterized repeat protein (TIGR01451 family)
MTTFHKYKYRSGNIHKKIFASIAILIFIPIHAKCQESFFSIQNTASVRFISENKTLNILSNTVNIDISPYVDVTIEPVSASLTEGLDNSISYTYSFIVANSGNVEDRLDLTAAFVNSSGAVSEIWADLDHNNRLDPAVDKRIGISQGEYLIPARTKTRVFVVTNAPGNLRLAALSLNDDATAVTRHKNAEATIGPDNRTVTLIKTQLVDTQGANIPGIGTVITYTLTPHIPGTVAVTDVHITDPIPAGTDYVRGSLSLGGKPLSDSSDSDAGHYNSSTHSISVVIADSASADMNPQSQAVSFQVRIK